jgi:hypothetical protein
MNSVKDNELSVIAAERALGFDRTNPESKRRLDRFMRPAYAWAQSQSIQERAGHWTFEREYEAFELALKLHMEIAKASAHDRQILSAKTRGGKFAERDRWIREQYAQRKKRHGTYSISRFWMDLDRYLDLNQVEIPPELLAQLRPNGQLICEERLRQIVKAR